MTDEIEFEGEEDIALDAENARSFSDAVLYSSDWTVETILSQLQRDNIQLNPNFQRRDAWSNPRKSKFIESLIVGLPVPQLVLAELQGQRGRYLVLDGKQRLLSLLRFTESAEDRAAGFGLSGLEILPGLSRRKYYHILHDAEYSEYLNAFLNYTIRTVIIRNWPNSDFLHQVFLRLNTGSVKLSPQELRQAMVPGPFTTYADDFSADSEAIMLLLGRRDPDPRMRDVELLVRHVGFALHLTRYRGRMKSFLDEVCEYENQHWDARGELITETFTAFEAAITVLIEIFGDSLARKPDSRSFNRAIFDALAYFAAQEDVRQRMSERGAAVRTAYDAALLDQEFIGSVESDTAGIPNTVSRISIWGQRLSEVLGMRLIVPRIEGNRILIG